MNNALIRFCACRFHGASEKMSILQGDAPQKISIPKVHAEPQAGYLEDLNMAKKGKRSKRSRPSVISTARGLVYVGIPALTTYSDYTALVSAGRSSSEAIKQSVSQWAGISPSTNQFSMTTVVDQYTPIVAFTVADMVMSKAGVYKRLSRLIRF